MKYSIAFFAMEVVIIFAVGAAVHWAFNIPLDYVQLVVSSVVAGAFITGAQMYFKKGAC